MNNDKYIIDIENYLLHIEPIAKKYIIIEDIEYCVFSKKFRYPLLNKSECTDFYKVPQMSMYCAPMIKNILKVLLAKNSFYFKYFISEYKNSYFDDFNNSFNHYFKNDLDLIIPESTDIENIIVANFKNAIITNLNKDVYNFILTSIVSLKDFNIAIENLSNNLSVFLENKIDSLTDNVFIEKFGTIAKIKDIIFSQDRCRNFIEDNVDIIKSIFNSIPKDNGENIYKINGDGIFNVETIIQNFLPGITNEDLEYVYNIVNKMDDDILVTLPSNVRDYVLEIDDDSIYHIITTTKHILEVRLKEIENKE